MCCVGYLTQLLRQHRIKQKPKQNRVSLKYFPSEQHGVPKVSSTDETVFRPDVYEENEKL